jgi:ABC-type branched-subunit amino acid transport system substrate-binding protein
MRRFGSVSLATVVVVSIIGLASITTAGAQGGDNRQGVTSSQISVGGIASPPSVLNVPYQDGFAGAKAYFDKINKAGGLFGRKLKLVAQLSDQGAPSGNIQAARQLVEEKKVFAVLPVETNSFAGGKYLNDKGIPTFGYNIDAGYCGTQDEVLAIENASPNVAGAGGTLQQCPRSNIYGQAGSYLCFKCPSISPAVLAKQVGAKKAAILTYSHPSSTACGDGDEASFKKYGIDVAFEDRTLQFGFPDASADAQKMKDAGVDYVTTCMDFGGAYKIAQELKQAGATGVTYYAPEGYRQDTIDKYGQNLNGWVFRVGFTPWQVKPLPKGTAEYLAAMKKVGVKPSEQSQAGWINAALLVAGIKKAGKDFTWDSVNKAIAGITDFSADGILVPLDWGSTGNGHGPDKEACDAYVAVKNGKFVPVYGKPGQPFVCYPDNPQPDNLDSPYYRPLKAGQTAPAGAGSSSGSTPPSS